MNWPRINAEAPAKVVRTNCSRCHNGAGYIAGYAHVLNGVCFRCGGTGTDPVYRDWGFPAEWTDDECAAWNERREARNARARERAEERRREAAEKVWLDNVARFPALNVAAERIREGLYTGGFVFDVADKARRYELSDKAGAALTDAVERIVREDAVRAEAAAAKAERARPVEVGNGLEIEAKVISTKLKYNAYGETLKMLVEVDGGAYRLWGTVPRALDVTAGDMVRFVANVEVSDDDENFGFFSRPRKAEKLEVADA